MAEDSKHIWQVIGKGFRWAFQSFLFVMTAPMETD